MARSKFRTPDLAREVDSREIARVVAWRPSRPRPRPFAQASVTTKLDRSMAIRRACADTVCMKRARPGARTRLGLAYTRDIQSLHRVKNP